MKKNLLLIAIPIFLFSCSPIKMLPLKGNYPATPMVFTSAKSFDECWDNLVDIFAQKGLSIKIIDKSSGLIISDRSKMAATIEDKYGNVFDKKALVAIPCFIRNGKRAALIYQYNGAYTPQSILASSVVEGEWNVRIKKSISGGTIINVNITNLGYDSSTDNKGIVTISEYKSTGVFEKELSKLIGE